MFGPRSHADFRERLIHSLAPLRRCQSAIGQRQLDIFPNGEITNEIKTLEDEPDLAIAHPRAFGMIEMLDRFIAQQVTAAGGRIEQSQDREQRGFAAAGGTGDGHVIAVADFKPNARQRVRFDFVGEEHLFDVVQLN